MVEFAEFTPFQRLRSHFNRKSVQIVLAVVSFVAVLALFIAVLASPSSNSNSPSVVLLSALEPAEIHITDPEKLTVVGPYADQEGQPDPVEQEDKEENKGQIVRISSQGSVRGMVLKSRKGRNYNAFYQIPYARPPVGKYRFEPPQSPRRWFGIRNATVPGKECIQKEKYAPIIIAAGQEDCLYLNVYTPKLPEGRRDTSVSMPVMFYIHGGGPFGNGTRYGAKYFMDENIVLVTIEFRLGILGGFTTGSRNYPGNLGNKDIIMSLKWVQKNIQRFGGDPKRVVIFGNSSGSAHVHLLLLSQLSQGLFHRAIMQSGSAIMTDFQREDDPVELIRNFTSEVGCDRYWGNDRRLLRCLRDIEAEKIVLTQTQLQFPEFIVENGDSRSPFLTDKPWNIIQSGQVISVPLITGVNSNEFAHVALPYLSEDINLDQNFDELLPGIVGIPDDENHSAAKEFRKVYFGNRTIGNETRNAVFDLFSDHFAHSARVSGMLHAYNTGEPVYFYWLSKEAAKSYADSVRAVYPPPYGAAHADELQFLFLYNDYPEITVDSPWFQFSETMVRIWVSYAAEGRPISPTVEWKPIDLADNGMIWFNLDDELRYVEPFTERMALWDNYINQLYAGAPAATSSTTSAPIANTTKETTNATDRVPNTTAGIPDANGRVPITTERTSSTARGVPNTTERASSTAVRGPNTTERPSSTAVRVPTTTERVPTAATRVPNNTERASSTAMRVPNTTKRASTTATRVPNNTERASSTAARVPNTTERASSTATRMANNTERASSTAARVPNNTERTASTAERVPQGTSELATNPPAGVSITAERTPVTTELPREQAQRLLNRLNSIMSQVDA